MESSVCEGDLTTTITLQYQDIAVFIVMGPNHEGSVREVFRP
jgi:hypothetical protein